MRYTWDYNELRENRNRLINQQNNFNNPEIKDFLDSTINQYNLLMAGTNKKYNFLNSKYILANIEIILIDAINFENKNLLDYLTKTANIFKEREKDYVTSMPLTKDDNETFQENALAFFEIMTNKEMYDKASIVLNPNNHILNIVHSKNDNNCSGITFYDKFNNVKYICIERQSCWQDYHTIIHEIFHYIFSNQYISSNKNINSNISLLAEVEGIFANLLFAKFHEDIAKKKNIQYATIFKEKNINNFKERVLALAIKDFIVRDILLKTENIEAKAFNFSDYFQNINLTFNFKNFNIDFKNHDELINYIGINQLTLTQYSLAFLVAVDLYYIYLIDKEYAFYLLNNITHDITEESILKLLYKNNITFMEDNYSNLKKYIKK